MTGRLRTAGILLTATTAAVLAAPATVGAASPDMERFAFTGSFTEEICGLPIELEVEVSGLFGARPVKGSDGQAFLGMNVYRFQETWSTERGSLTLQVHGSFREKTASKVEGPVTYDPDGEGPLAPITSTEVWHFTAQDAGSFRMVSEDGRLLLHGTGVVRMEIDFDTLGDGAPGGNEIPGTFAVLREQTGHSFTDEQFCAAVVAELG